MNTMFLCVAAAAVGLFGGKPATEKFDRVYPHYRLTAVRFAELGKPGAEVRISNVKLTGFGAVMTRKVLNLVEMEDAPSLSIRFAVAAAY